MLRLSTSSRGDQPLGSLICNLPTHQKGFLHEHGQQRIRGRANDSAKVWSIRFLLFIAGLGGLLYGIDVGIIAGALPYLEATSGLNANQLSYVVAAVLLGSVISTLFAGMLADWMGRKKLMALSGLLFVLSIPMIALGARIRAAGRRAAAARHQRRA